MKNDKKNQAIWQQLEEGVENIFTGEKWHGGPHELLGVEKTFDNFISEIGGKKISILLSKNPNFPNADYIFESEKIILELKEIQTEFYSTPTFYKEYDKLNKKLYDAYPNFKPYLLGGKENYPDWYITSYYKIARTPIGRILKKANSQIKETKNHFNIRCNSGVLLLVNDGFTNIPPYVFMGLVSDLLVNSYSEIDCFVYITVNSYVILNNTDKTPSLLWVPMYSPTCENTLQEFINNLGGRWREYLDKFIRFTNTPKTEASILEVLGNATYLYKGSS